MVTTDIDSDDRFYKKLIATASHLTGVSSAFSMEQITYATALPLELAARDLPA